MIKFWAFKVESKEQSKFLQKLGNLYGYKWDDCIGKYYDQTDNYLCVNAEKRFYQADYQQENEDYQVVTLKEFISILVENKIPPEKTVTVKLNNEYSAVFIPGGNVKVGCQTFSAENIKKFIEEYSKS